MTGLKQPRNFFLRPASLSVNQITTTPAQRLHTNRLYVLQHIWNQNRNPGSQIFRAPVPVWDLSSLLCSF